MSEGEYERQMGERFFDQEIAPMHRRSGVPDEGLAFMRRKYLNDVDGNQQARDQLVTWASASRGVTQQDMDQE